MLRPQAPGTGAWVISARSLGFQLLLDETRWAWQSSAVFSTSPSGRVQLEPRPADAARYAWVASLVQRTWPTPLPRGLLHSFDVHPSRPPHVINRLCPQVCARRISRCARIRAGTVPVGRGRPFPRAGPPLDRSVVHSLGASASGAFGKTRGFRGPLRGAAGLTRGPAVRVNVERTPATFTAVHARMPRVLPLSCEHAQCGKNPETVPWSSSEQAVRFQPKQTDGARRRHGFQAAHADPGRPRPCWPRGGAKGPRARISCLICFVPAKDKGRSPLLSRGGPGWRRHEDFSAAVRGGNPDRGRTLAGRRIWWSAPGLKNRPGFGFRGEPRRRRRPWSGTRCARRLAAS